MHRKLHLLACCFTLFLAAGLRAQDPELVLPRYLTDEEKALAAPVPPSAPDELPNDPPPVPVRTMAEWEELQALLIAWRGHAPILTEIVRAAREECRVIVACEGQNTITSAQNYLLNQGVDLSSNVEFINVPSNSIWIRDYGPNSVYAYSVDSLYLVDWIYNRTTRPKDDSMATSIAPYLGVPLFRTKTAPADLVNTGGNFMADGQGTAFASRLILSENAAGNPYGVSVKSEAQVDGIMNDFMGIGRYIKMTALPYDVIHHIDMHMKLLDEETLLVGQYPPGVADGPQIEANLQYVLSNFTSAFGTPYKIIRIPMPPDAIGQYPDFSEAYRTYANAVFVNKTVIVPFYEQQYDTTAQRIWEEALPGYKIVGVNCNAIITSKGAIHCITKEVGVPDPLRIVHQELPCMDNAQWDGYPVLATVEHRSGIAGASIHYTTDLSLPWQSVALEPFTGDTTYNYLGIIPEQPAGTTVYYYLEATAASGKTVTRPLPAPAGYWSFCVEETVSTADAPEARLQAIYPNPASAITVLPVHTERQTAGTLRVFNAFGQLIETVFTGELPAGPSNHFIDAAGYAPGTYFVELRTASGRGVQKLVVR